MSQYIHVIKELRSTVLKSLNTEEYDIAESLRHKNQEAYKLMQITYQYPDDNIKHIISCIDNILELWKDVHSRNSNYKDVGKYLLQLKPYIIVGKQKYSYLLEEEVKDNINKLTSISVSGNAVWEVYLEEINNAKKLLKTINDLRAKIAKIFSNRDDSYSDLVCNEENDFDDEE